ncbi:sulfatase [Pontiella sulfatireligans]|uniref:Arylsulfatase n=1 Tax=Pontiella sulfatireligans TaxID=2750658 RepID=A0A6C2UKI2_9BACT|nr:sulfatase [Pontiella sulfatireligans]SPS74403.1 sulfatase S1_16 [Kiritimatiellales bacterium]VGO20393.1 Arylsulfatase [Pontiella sulfatireligans]
MKKWNRLLIGMGAVLTAWSCMAADKPNIVLFFVDDLGWSDVGYRNPDFESPNIDRLSRDGLNFEQAYIATPTCSPSRGTLLTGKHPARLKMVRHISNNPKSVVFVKDEDGVERTHLLKTDPAQFPSANWLNLDAPTYPEILRKQGYTTLHVGKWHLGYGEEHASRQYGYDREIGTVYAPRNNYYPADYQTTIKPRESDELYRTDMLTDGAVEFIETHDKDQPFLMSFCYYAVHSPHAGRKDLVKHFEERGFSGGYAHYLAMLTSVDQSIGRVRGALKKQGLEKNTIIIFLSDQGGIFENKPFHGGKMVDTLYEGGARVPFIFYWPGVTEAGAANNSLVQSTDLFPTILEMIGEDATKFAPLDGVSLLSTIRNNSELERGEPLFGYRAYEDLYASVREGDWKLLAYRSGIVKLYNIPNDIGEKNDLAASNPEKVQELTTKLMAWEKEMGVEKYSGVQ